MTSVDGTRSMIVDDPATMAEIGTGERSETGYANVTTTRAGKTRKGKTFDGIRLPCS